MPSDTFEDRLAKTFGLSDEEASKLIDEAPKEDKEQPNNKEADDGAKEQPATAETAGSEETQPAKPNKQAQDRATTGNERQPQQRDTVDNLQGAARRFHGNWKRAEEQRERVERELEIVRAELDTFRAAASLPQQLGLSPQEVIVGMQLVEHFKRNPVEAAKEVLAQVLAAGYNIEDLVGSINAQAMRTMVQSAVQPLTQAQQRAAEEREAQQREAQLAERASQLASREVEAVIERFPWATVQDNEIAALMEAAEAEGYDMSYREAVLELQAYALQHGLDLNKPLTPQVRAAKQAQPTQRSNARGVGRSVSSAAAEPRRSALSAEAPTRDIVREAMLEAGINIQE